MIKILIGIFAAAVIGGGGWYYFSHKSASDSGANGQKTMSTESSPQSTESFTAKSSLKDIVARGGSWKCTFAIDAGGTSSTGTVYAAGGKVRSDFESKVPQVNMTIESHMVTDGAYAYTWTSSMPQGFKMAIDANAKASTATSGHQDFDYNGALDYNCVAWPTDESKFVVPSNITFTTVK